MFWHKLRRPGPDRSHDAEMGGSARNAPPAMRTLPRQRARLERAERAAEPDDDPEATARVRVFLDRMIRPP